MRSILCFLTIFCLPIFATALEIEEAIYPQAQYYEQIDHLDPSRYAPEQFRQIEDLLVEAVEGKLRLMSYNCLVDFYDTQLPLEHHWKNRKAKVACLIDAISPDVVGIQELQSYQVEQLQQHLGPEFDFCGQSIGGVNEDVDGFFYKKKRLRLVEHHIFALNLPAHPHPLTRCLFEDQKTKKRFIVYNTHLPWASTQRRSSSVKEIAALIEGEEVDLPFILMGDMNTLPNRPDLVTLPFYDGPYLKKQIEKMGLKDGMDCAHLGHLGPIASYTNDSQKTTIEPFEGQGVAGVILDHIFVSDGVEVLLHLIEPAKVEGEYPSDHMPVVIDCVLKAQ